MHSILKSDLKMAKVSARWIPHLLSEDDCGPQIDFIDNAISLSVHEHINIQTFIQNKYRIARMVNVLQKESCFTEC